MTLVWIPQALAVITAEAKVAQRLRLSLSLSPSRSAFIYRCMSAPGMSAGTQCAAGTFNTALGATAVAACQTCTQGKPSFLDWLVCSLRMELVSHVLHG